MKKKIPLSQNKTLGHTLSVSFFVIIGYLFFVAASNMNYIWSWSSVPKYFAYKDVVQVESPIDGKFIVQNGKYFVINSDDKQELEITDKYKINYVNNEDIYEGDEVASTTSWEIGPIGHGLLTTLEISFLASILAAIMAITVAFMRLSSYQVFKDIGGVYIAIVRGTPLLVQIFLFYFIIANLFHFSSFTAGVLSLGLFFGAYSAEILRGAIQSIDKGQAEAAKSLGISQFQTMRHIVLPQALKRALPTLVGEVISLVKDSSLVSVISITDLTKVGREIVANTFSPFETWIVIAGVYLIITFTLSYIGHVLEKRMAAKGGMS